MNTKDCSEILLFIAYSKLFISKEMNKKDSSGKLLFIVYSVLLISKEMDTKDCSGTQCSPIGLDLLTNSGKI